ncbi:SDR family oxidoreductase [Actinomadura hibisca]|uniref:SDR family oxidoreductase n=1 Tax=Actinomadura hibisca TaxID=68565 RepID=UPI00082F9B48|nr:SDR family oxidoreductase [Actinomadura hibisca]
MTVLVLGATGKTGLSVVDALVARGVRVRAASRNPGPASAGVEPVRFDWADRATWGPALREIDGLYIVGPYALPGEPALVRDLLAAAPHASRVVLLSVLGVDRLPDVIPMAVWEADVRASGKEWTILRPNWFQQNFGEGFGTLLRENGMLALPAADAELGFVDTRDIAEVAAAALTEEGHAGETYILTGPEALMYDQVVRVLGEAAGRELRYIPISADQFADGLREAGLDEGSITWQLGLFRLIREGTNALVNDTVERITGRPARSLKSYASENAALWGSGPQA